MIATNRGAGVKTPTSWWQWSQLLFPGCQWGAAAVLWGCAFIALPEKPVQGAPGGCTDLGDAVHAGWGDSYLPHPAVLSTLRGTTLAMGQTQVTEETLTNTWWPQGRTAVCYQLHPCWRFTPHGSSHTVLQSSQLLCLPHPDCGSTTMKVHFLLVFPVEAWPLKKINWVWTVSKEFKLDPEVWVNDLKNQRLQIWCFTGSVKLDSYCWWHSAIVSGVTANWGGTKLCLWRAVLSLSWQEPGVPNQQGQVNAAILNSAAP